MRTRRHTLEVVMTHGAGGEGLLIDRQEMRERVEHAISTEKFMLRLGWLVLALAITSLAVTAALWLHGDITMEQALAAIFGVIITGILSGASAYAAGINVGLGASRLVLALEAEEAPGDRPPERGPGQPSRVRTPG